MLGQDVAGAGRDDEVGPGRDDGAGRGEVVDDDDVGEQRLDRGAHVRRGPDQVDGPLGAGGHVGDRRRRGSSAPLTSSVARPASSVRR